MNPEIRSPRTPPILPQLLSTREAAVLCGCGERTLWRWSRSGVVPRPVKIGPGKQGAVRYRRAELLAWIEARCPRVAPPKPEEKAG